MGAVHKGGDGGGRLTFSASAGAPQRLRSTDIYESAELRTPEVSQDGAGWKPPKLTCVAAIQTPEEQNESPAGENGKQRV